MWYNGYMWITIGIIYILAGLIGSVALRVKWYAFPVVPVVWLLVFITCPFIILFYYCGSIGFKFRHKEFFKRYGKKGDYFINTENFKSVNKITNNPIIYVHFKNVQTGNKGWYSVEDFYIKLDAGKYDRPLSRLQGAIYEN